jgi:hypothetical protein
VYRHSATRFRFFNQKYHWDHQQYGYAKQPEAIDVGQHRGLPPDRTLD